MIRIYIRRKNEIAGHTFICKSSIKKDIIAILPHVLVVDGLITEDEWATSRESIIEKFKLFVTESYVDGRSKAARSTKKFNWREVLNMKVGETFKPMAYKTISNWLSIEIEISNCGSMVRYRIGENSQVSDWKEIHFTKAGKPYFNARHTRYYLNEFMKI